MTQRSRHFRFTFNNYTEEDIKTMIEAFINDGVIYYIFGKEIAPTTGTPHLQGHISYRHPRSWEAVKKRFSQRISWRTSEIPNKSAEYCKKDGNYTEWGEAPKGRGKRTDICAVKEVIEKGGGMKDVIETTTSYQALRTAEILLKYKEKKRNWKTRVLWFYGDTGCNKTRMANELMPEAWWSGKNLKWFEGYDAHKHVIIDDFRKDFCTFHELLRILDRYEYRIEVKGSSRQFVPEHIIITCPSHPADLYDGRTNEDIQQLLRRIDEIWLFKKEGPRLMPTAQVHSTEVGEGNTSTSPTNPDLDLLAEINNNNNSIRPTYDGIQKLGRA